MAEQKQPAVMTERSRVLPTKRFEESQIISMDLPKDTVLKGLFIRLSGAVQTTFASGTPVAKAESTMDSLISRIDVVVNGDRTIKSIRPHLLHIQQLFAMGVATERAASAGAAPATDNYPTVEGGFPFGTTTQYTTVRETVYLPFEHIYCEPGLGREETYLNLKRATSAEIRFTTAAFANLLGVGNTAPVVWGNNTMQIEVTTVERQDIAAERLFMDWKQTQKTVQIGGESRDLSIDINDGNLLSGLLFFAQDGAAGTSTTATGRLASNLLLGKMELRKNGTESLVSTNFKQLQARNRAQYGVNAPIASNVSRLDGIAHMNLLSRKDIGTALPTMRPYVDQIQLIVDTANSSIVSYTSPAQLTIVTEEIVMPRG